MKAKIINQKSDVVIAMSWEEAKTLRGVLNAYISLPMPGKDVDSYTTFANDLENAIIDANEVRDMDIPGTAEFMVTAESNDLYIGRLLDWNNGDVQHVVATKELALAAAQDAIHTWMAYGMQYGLEIDISEGPDECLIDEYGCPREGFSWSQYIRSPFTVIKPNEDEEPTPQYLPRKNTPPA